MEMLLQQVTNSSLMSMLDGFSRYNKVLLVEGDHYKTAFMTPWGTCVYDQFVFWIDKCLGDFPNSHGSLLP